MRTGKKARKILNRADDMHIYTLAELAARMHMSIPTMSKKINDPKLLSLGEAIRLCSLTGFTLDELSKI